MKEGGTLENLGNKKTKTKTKKQNKTKTNKQTKNKKRINKSDMQSVSRVCFITSIDIELAADS